MEENLNLTEGTESSHESSSKLDIEEIMDKMSDFAESKGLTEEKLQEILIANSQVTQ